MTPRENALMAYRHKVPEYIPCFFTDIDLFQANPAMERYLGYTQGEDGFGVDWTYEPHVHAPMTTHGKIVLDDISKWESTVKFPDLDAIDWKKQADIDVHTDFMALMMGEGIVPFKDGHSIYDTGRLRVCMVLNGMFERLHSLMGFENALAATVEDPDSCEAFFSAMADYKIKYFEKIAKYYDVDVINAHDDYGSNDRLFMSPVTWRRLLKPHLKRMVDAAHDCGLIYQHHSCGYIEPIFGDLVEIGVDAIDPVQKCNKHAQKLKKQYGDKITFCGGFDNMGVLEMPGVTTEDIKKEYHRVIDSLAPGGSYVIYPISATFDFVQPLMEEHFAYGMNFYSQQK